MIFRKLRKVLERLHLRRKPFFIAENPVYAGIVAGAYSYGSPTMLGHDGSPETKVSIGRYCSIAHGVKFLLKINHPIEAPTTFPLMEILGITDELPFALCRGPVSIGHDVWIGLDATIMGGVTIGDGAIVGANAVVAKNVAPYAIVVGNPAREVRKRFDDATIARLQKIRWWDWPEALVRKHARLLAHGPMEEFLTVAERLDDGDRPADRA